LKGAPHKHVHGWAHIGHLKHQHKPVKMVGKKSGRALLREEGMGVARNVSQIYHPRPSSSARFLWKPGKGIVHADANHFVGLQRTDNSLQFSNWPVVQMINQKNYYT
jgi:hypothetical protein